MLGIILLVLAGYAGFAGWPWWWAAALGAALGSIEMIRRYVTGMLNPWLEDRRRISAVIFFIAPVTIIGGAVLFTAPYFLGSFIRSISN